MKLTEHSKTYFSNVQEDLINTDEIENHIVDIRLKIIL